MIGEQGHLASFCIDADQRLVKVVQDTRRVDGLGGEVWPGAYVLCNFLAKHRNLYCRGKSVIELGAGCGLCGLVASALGAKQVVLTDEFPDLLEYNLKQFKQQSASDVIVQTLRWEEHDTAVTLKERFEVVLGSDITQLGRQSHAILLSTIRFLLKPGSTSHVLISSDLCCKDCRGSCDIASCICSHFINVARAHDFHCEMFDAIQICALPSMKNAVGALGKPFLLDAEDYGAIIQFRL